MANELSKQKVDDVRAWLTGPAVLAELGRAVREKVKPITIARIIQSAMVRQPKLFDCTRHSLWGSILQSLELGLLPDGREAALIPYQIKGTLTCTFQPMYQGLVKLASNAGVVVIPPVSVYSNERFTIQYGMIPPIVHEPLPPDRRGEFVACYSIALVNEQPVPDFMWKAEIDAIRDRSKGYQNAKKYDDDENPWIRDYPEMAKKTVFKRQAKYLPKSAELSQALSADDDAEFGHAGLSVDVIDAPPGDSKAAKMAANVRAKTPLPEPQPEPQDESRQETAQPEPERPAPTPAATNSGLLIDSKRARQLKNALLALEMPDRTELTEKYKLKPASLDAGLLKMTEAQADQLNADIGLVASGI